jgi:hypothetical protein
VARACRIAADDESASQAGHAVSESTETFASIETASGLSESSCCSSRDGKDKGKGKAKDIEVEYEQRERVSLPDKFVECICLTYFLDHYRGPTPAYCLILPGDPR